MRTIVLAVCILAALIPSSLAAQTTGSRFYFGATTAAEAGARGPILGGAIPTVGGLIGVRLSDAWSVEIEVDRGFRITDQTDEAVWLSFAPPNSTFDEIQRQGIRARFERTQTAGPGFAAHVMWRSRAPGRVNVGIFGGVAARAYDSRVVRTTLFVPPELNLSPDRPELQPEDATRNMTGGGISGGIAIFGRVTPALTIAPELRYSTGIITNDPYHIFRVGVRVLWGF